MSMTQYMHRWIRDNLFDDPPERSISTLIAKWWPGHYLLVYTLIDEPAFATHVVRCDKDGWSGNDDPFFWREYATLEEAKIGHKETVARFS